MKIRPAKISDVRVIKMLQGGLVDFERAFDNRIKDGKVQYYNVLNILRDSNAKLLVCEIDNKIVGCGFGEIMKEPDWVKNRKYGYIGMMFVHKDYRNQGIGKKIIK